VERTITKRISNFFLDIAFPKKCVVCGKLDTLFCDACRGEIIFLKTQNCPFCLKITPRGRVCSSCRNKTALTGVYVVAYFEGPLKEAIHKFKYEFIKSLKDDLADLSWPYLEDFPKKSILTVVPSSQKRLNWRGYNQAEEVAEILAKKTGIQYRPDLLKRVDYRTPQTQLSRKERFKNVENTFKPRKKIDLKGKEIIIFDDLVTSGATLNACAHELRKMGASRVWGFVLARNK